MRWTKWLTGALIVVGALLVLNLMQARYGDLNLLSEAMAQNRAAAGGELRRPAVRVTEVNVHGITVGVNVRYLERRVDVVVVDKRHGSAWYDRIKFSLAGG